MSDKTITVAIATARTNEDTKYAEWFEHRKNFLDRKLKSKHLTGEFAALLAACLGEDLPYHIDYQLTALALGTRLPDRILIVDRVRDDTGGSRTFTFEDSGKPLIGTVVEPMVSPRELELSPGSSLASPVGVRSNKISMGCADKNTAVVLCETDYLIMLDDCCLPGFGLVQAAYDVCERRNVLLIGHQQMYIEPGDDVSFEISQANWSDKHEVLTADEAKQRRRVFGIWAMPLSHILAMNGFNTDLDGDRGGLDVELIARMDRYLHAQEDIRYEMHPAARCYEIGHDMPWRKDINRTDEVVMQALPSGWSFKATGLDLKAIRKELGIDIGTDKLSVLDESDEVVDEIRDLIDELDPPDEDE